MYVFTRVYLGLYTVSVFLDSMIFLNAAHVTPHHIVHTPESPAVQGVLSLPLLSTAEVIPGALSPDLGTPLQERHGPTGLCPEECHKIDPRDAIPPYEGRLKELELFR